jgi:hypothetical protein
MKKFIFIFPYLILKYSCRKEEIYREIFISYRENVYGGNYDKIYC